MSTAQVVTEGYGAWSQIPLVITTGYFIGEQGDTWTQQPRAPGNWTQQTRSADIWTQQARKT